MKRANRWSSLVSVSMLSLYAPALLAHSASDAYLSITLDQAGGGANVLARGQWDIALRDLDFVLQLDDNGDGRLTWGEVRHHQAAIEHYAYQYLRFDGGAGNACSVRPTRQMIDNHADGAYAALFFEVLCARAPQKINLRYSMFFSIDPSHRGILVMHRGADTATAVLSPQNFNIDFAL
jgi:hypothetical protein